VQGLGLAPQLEQEPGWALVQGLELEHEVRRCGSAP